MYPLSAVLIAFAVGGLAVGAVVWLVMWASRQSQRIAELERRLANGPEWAANMKLDHRAQLASIAVLQELAAQDQLDALMRLSPDAVHRVVEKIAPQLFTRDNVK